MFRWGSVCGERAAVMGIVNVTPDSFSDGGRFLDRDAAVRHGLDLVSAGADLLDVGGESTRPGSEPVDVDEELRRTVPVVTELVARSGVPVSIDTTKAAVAAEALQAGAAIVNDVSGGRSDDAMLPTVADHGAGFVAMHMLGEPRTMQDDPRYDDVTLEVQAFLAARIDAAIGAGVARDTIAADPGIGFGKTVEHDLELLARMGELVDGLDVPIVIGTSRKRFLGALLRGEGGDLPEPEARDDATLGTVVWAVERGARIARVHDSRGAAQAIALLDAIGKAAA